MEVITYHITLLEPTLVSALGGDPNSSVTLDYLPGSVLRGAVIGKYLRSRNTVELSATDPEARQLFLDGTTRYLNGYPLDLQGRRTLPTPASWQQKKGHEGDIFDLAVEPPDDDDTRWQNVGQSFCSFTDNTAYLINPDRHISIHNARDRMLGRPLRDSGAVFRYDALAPGQTFSGVILCDRDSDASTLLPLLTGEVALGASRSGGYGRASILAEGTATEPANWREIGGTLTSDVDGRLTVTLLSDALVRDHTGQFAVDLNAVTEAVSLSLDLQIKPVHPLRAFVGKRVIGGFNRKWGLPLPQSLAVKMGSVIVYEAPYCDNDKLRRLEAGGIGERRAEGFGRVAINWQTDETLTVDTSIPWNSGTPVIIPPDTPSSSLARDMVDRILRKRLDDRLLEAANAVHISRPPHRSQLSRLRNVIHNELAKESPDSQRVRSFLGQIRARNTARRQFERASVGATNLLDWLGATCHGTSEDECRRLLHVRTEDFSTLGGLEAEMTNSISVEYVLRYIDAVLAGAIKQEQGERT